MSTEMLISGAIALTMPIFSQKTFDLLLKKEIKPNIATDETVNIGRDENLLVFNKNSDLIYEENARRRFIYSVTIGIIGLILAAYIKTPSTRWGVGIGSFLILIQGLYGYWGNMGDMHKWLVSAIALITCVMISVKLYDVGSISEILNNPFGKINV